MPDKYYRLLLKKTGENNDANLIKWLSKEPKEYESKGNTMRRNLYEMYRKEN